MYEDYTQFAGENQVLSQECSWAGCGHYHDHHFCRYRLIFARFFGRAGAGRGRPYRLCREPSAL